MNTTQQEKCRKAYYHTDIEPTLDRLQQVTDIVSNFEAEGADRLQSALSMKFMDVADIERFTEYIAQACDKMEKELLRLKKYEKDFNQEFATDHNNYYNSDIVKNFNSCINVLFADSKDADLMEFSA